MRHRRCFRFPGAAGEVFTRLFLLNRQAVIRKSLRNLGRIWLKLQVLPVLYYSLIPVHRVNMRDLWLSANITKQMERTTLILYVFHSRHTEPTLHLRFWPV